MEFFRFFKFFRLFFLAFQLTISIQILLVILLIQVWLKNFKPHIYFLEIVLLRKIDQDHNPVFVIIQMLIIRNLSNMTEITRNLRCISSLAYASDVNRYNGNDNLDKLFLTVWPNKTANQMIENVSCPRVIFS